jgi:hypothetical protein
VRHDRAGRTNPRLLCAKYPEEFEHGYRFGFTGELQTPCDAAGYPIGFHTWEIERKNSWFSAWNHGNVQRQADNG